MRSSSGLTGQYILNKRITSLPEALLFGLYGMLVTGPFNSFFNNFTGIIVRATNGCKLATLAWANLVHMPLLQALLLSYKAFFESMKRGDDFETTRTAIAEALRVGWFRTVKAVWPVNIPCTFLVQTFIPLQFHMNAYQVMAYFTTTINVVKAAQTAKEQQDKEDKAKPR